MYVYEGKRRERGGNVRKEEVCLDDCELTCASHDPKIVEKMRYLEESSSSVKER